MEIIIDIQCFKNNKNQAIPKEVAVCALNQNFSAHWVVLPPCSSNSLCKEVKKQNDWLTRHHHGFEWREGDVTLKRLYKNLESVCNIADKIYVRGEVKAALLEKITTRRIINLEQEQDSPALRNLPWADAYCLQHSFKYNHLKFTCALNNVIRLKLLLRTGEKFTPEQDINFVPPTDLCDEQPGDYECSVAHSWTYSGGLCSRSDTPHMVETSGVCVQYRETQ